MFCKLLGVIFFVLEVRSQSGNNVSLPKNVTLCPNKKGPSPKAQLSPSKVLVLAKRRRSSAGSSLRATSPDCPAVISEGARCPTQLALGSSGHLYSGDQVPDCDPARLPLLLGSRDRDGGEVYHRLKAWAKTSGWPR